MRYARDRKLGIIGDIPIFVSGDSADVWANPQLFQLDAQSGRAWWPGCRPITSAPPGSSGAIRCTIGRPSNAPITPGGWTGCGPPCCWSIWCGWIIFAASRPTGKSRRAGPTPWSAIGSRRRAQDLLQRIQQQLGGLPLIAEDLGVITPEVEALRDRFQLPGMRVLQFAFGDGPRQQLSAAQLRSGELLVYTGTHDNDTTRGWYATAQEKERDHVRRYTGPRRQRHRLGPDATGLVQRRRLRHRPAAGRSGSGHRSAA